MQILDHVYEKKLAGFSLYFPPTADWDTDTVVVILLNHKAEGNSLGNIENTRLDGTWTSK